MTTNYQRALDLADHIAAVDESPRELVNQLRDARLLMPELPKGSSEGFWLPNSRTSISASRNSRYIVAEFVNNPLICTSELARSFAFSLLAAAEYSDQEQDR